jgi:hypothetical protein
MRDLFARTTPGTQRWAQVLELNDELRALQVACRFLAETQHGTREGEAALHYALSILALGPRVSQK